jgi:2-dehydropantoate 2-reductase
VRAEELEPKYDLVLLTNKAYDLDSAMDAIAPAMNGHCTIVPTLNGLAHLERLDNRFGAEHILGGACMIDVKVDNDGVIQHMGALQRMVFGERDGSKSKRSEEFANALAAANIDHELSDKIMLEMWEKLVFLCALAATACLFRGNGGEIVSAPGGLDALTRILDTNIEIARREGSDPRDSVMKGVRDRFSDPNGKWETSMQRDIEAGNPVEADHIVGYMLDKARKHKLDDTILSLAYTHLKTYEARRAAGRLPLRQTG